MCHTVPLYFGKSLNSALGRVLAGDTKGASNKYRSTGKGPESMISDRGDYEIRLTLSTADEIANTLMLLLCGSAGVMKNPVRSAL